MLVAGGLSRRSLHQRFQPGVKLLVIDDFAVFNSDNCPALYVCECRHLFKKPAIPLPEDIDGAFLVRQFNERLTVPFDFKVSVPDLLRLGVIDIRVKNRCRLSHAFAPVKHSVRISEKVHRNT